MGLPVTIEQHGGAYTLTVHIPPRRNGEPNNGAMGRVASLVATVVPAAFDPDPKPEPVLVPHEIARAAIRDRVLKPASADSFDVAGDWVAAPADDDEGEPIPGYRCANGACVGD